MVTDLDTNPKPQNVHSIRKLSHSTEEMSLSRHTTAAAYLLQEVCYIAVVTLKTKFPC